MQIFSGWDEVLVGVEDGVQQDREGQGQKGQREQREQREQNGEDSTTDLQSESAGKPPCQTPAWLPVVCR